MKAADGGLAGVAPPSPGRIKRQIQGRSHRFALVCPPGLEAVCLDEARRLGLALAALPGEDAPRPGPILEWEGRLEELYRVCLFARVASRVLVRVAGFRAGAREELFRKTANEAWELWLPGGCELAVEAHVRYSRISHEGMAAATVREAIDRRLEAAGLARSRLPPTGPAAAAGAEADEEDGAPAPASGGQRLIVRIDDNQVSLSLDASGDHLHRRGWRVEQGAAPIRENLAAGLLLWAGWPALPFAATAGGERRLENPMCGSGTFAIEAAGLLAGLPAACGRSFACQAWPSYNPSAFAWWERQAASALPGAAGWSVAASDLDPAMVGRAEANARRALGAEPGSAGQAIAWSSADFFGLEPAGSGFLVLNPPYGLRLADQGGTLYPKLFRRLAAAWADWWVLVLGPEPSALGPLGGRLERRCVFRHGGLAIAAWLFRPQGGKGS